MTRYSTLAFLVLFSAGCKRNEQSEHGSASTFTTSSENPTARVDTTAAAKEPLPHFVGWIIGRDENVPNSGSRFSGHADRYRSGALVIYLDTSFKRAYPGEPPHEYAHADSLVVRDSQQVRRSQSFVKLDRRSPWGTQRASRGTPDGAVAETQTGMVFRHR
jgi:hypothetical protein